jgi:L-lactate dehydrogenase (cytochrome)
MQLYVDKKRHKSEALVEKINGHKQLKAVFVTVDASAPGKREKDERLRSTVAVVRRLSAGDRGARLTCSARSIMQASGISGGKIATDNKGGGIGRSVGGFIDPKLSWDDIKWLRKHTQLPIGLKGVQSVEVSEGKTILCEGLEAESAHNNRTSRRRMIWALMRCISAITGK